MTETEKKVPELRFKGFVDDWEQRKLGDTLVEMKSGLSRLLSSEDIGLPVIRANNINNGNLDLVNDIKYWYVNDPQGANTRNYLVHKNDILVNFINSETKMGTATIVTTEPIRDTIYTTNVLKLKTNENNNPYFIFSLTMTGSYDKYVKIITKPAVNQASFTTVDFKKYEFFVPELEEQTRIGNLLKQLDDTIALHQRKLTLLKQLKEAYLQLMFPQIGENSPALRFAGFSNPWEQCKLGDLSESLNYGLNASASEFDGENKYIRITDIDDNSHRFIQHGLTSPNTDLSNADDYLLKEGDILFARTGASVGKTYQYDRIDGKVYYAGFLIRARISPAFNSNFIFQNSLTSNYHNFIKITSQRSGQPGVNAQEYANFSILVPKREEQDTLGDFFKQLDDTIALNQQKVTHLQSLKSTLLNKMFI